MQTVTAKRVKEINAQIVSPEVLVLGVKTAGEESFFSLHPKLLKRLIERLLVVSVDPKLLSGKRPPPSGGGVEKLLTLPIERISASHAPATGNVGVRIRMPNDMQVVFEMGIQEGLALAQQLQSAAGKAQAPKSTVTH